MPGWATPYFSSWSCGEPHPLTLLKVPEQVKLNLSSGNLTNPPSLSTLDKPDQPPRNAPTLASLPIELHYTILHHLAPVDRVCLALTCHRLCASVLASPRLTVETWMRFTTLPDFPNHFWNPHATHLNPSPDYYQLSQRLAHGWVNKSEWRYCWKCHKILPRSEQWWWNTCDQNGNKRLKGKKATRWSIKTGVEKDIWLTWSKRKRLKWLVDVWCKAAWEDSSVINCEWCRDRLYSEDADQLQVENAARTEPAKTTTINYSSGSKDLNVKNFIGTRHPVECPSCLERELTISWKPHKRTVFKKVLWSTCGCLSDWGSGLLWCLGSTIIGLLMLIWECLRWVVVTATFGKLIGARAPPQVTVIDL